MKKRFGNEFGFLLCLIMGIALGSIATQLFFEDTIEDARLSVVHSHEQALSVLQVRQMARAFK